MSVPPYSKAFRTTPPTSGWLRAFVVVLGVAVAVWSTVDAVTLWRVAALLESVDDDVGLARIESAEGRMQRVAALAPAHASVHARIGTLASMRYRWRGDSTAADDAVAAFERAVALNRWSSSLWASYGDALVTVDRPADAVVRYLEALRRDPSNASIHARLGRAHHTLGDVQAARTSYLEAQSIVPTAVVRRLLEDLHDGRTP